jgi:DNA sulfur modification protein DndC
LTQEIRDLYLDNDVPWVIGYSGGKDSTAVLQLVWLALRELPEDRHAKPVHVISTDTLVENPVVAAWVTASLDQMAAAATEQNMPFQPHRLVPEVKDSFWVNLIGKGYPAPRPKFRWCTERLKIKPSNAFIRRVVRRHGEAILVLGIRKAESQARARAMHRHEAGRVRDRLSPNASLPNSLVYSPIEDWTNDEVWVFLMQIPNPWGYRNKDLLTMYQGASADGECPLVVDSSTPSCGDSRFGCWTCTLVDHDKSLNAMIQNDHEKEWMLPLADLRRRLDPRVKRDEAGREHPDHPDVGTAGDAALRDFRRMNGTVQYRGRPSNEPHSTEGNDDRQLIPGPYKQFYRELLLRELLEAQTWIRTQGPENLRDVELITQAELDEIRRIWVFDKHEIEDAVPRIYREATGHPFPGLAVEEHLVLRADDVDLLREVCDGDELHFEMTRALVAVEKRYRSRARRAGLFDALEKEIRRSFYRDRADAVERSKTVAAIRSRERGELRGPDSDHEARPSSTVPDHSRDRTETASASA